MADLTPNYDLQLKRLHYRKAQLVLQIQGYEVRKAEIAEELAKINESMLSLEKTISEVDSEIESLKNK